MQKGGRLGGKIKCSSLLTFFSVQRYGQMEPQAISGPDVASSIRSKAWLVT